MIFSLLKNSTSYFRPYRNYFIAIYGAFFAFPIRELILVLSPEQTSLRFSTLLIIGAGVWIATLWGYMAAKLHLHPEPFSIRLALSNFRRPIYLSYILYLVPMVLTLVVGWGDPGSIDLDPRRVALYLVDGAAYRSIGYSPLFLAAAASLTIAFVLYPFLVLIHLRAQLKDREIRYALKVFASCFGATAALLLSSYALSSFGYSIQAPVHVVSVILLIIAVRAFRRPTFLKAFLGIAPSLESTPHSTRADRMILIYGAEEEKLGPLSRYILEGVDQRSRVLYFHREDETIVRKRLAERGVNVQQNFRKGNLRLSPLESLYRGGGNLYEEALDSGREFASEARTLGKEGLRMIIDYGDYIKRPTQKFIEHLADPKWTSPDHYVHVLMAFNSNAFQGQENALAMLRSKVPVLNLPESVDFFSRTVGLSHSEITGKKILLEYDPLSDYERILKSIHEEATSNFERIAVFTRRDSPVHSVLGEEPRLKTFILTSRVSYPRVEGENQILLPAYDSSLLLDALNKTIEAYAASLLTVIFDNISHYIFTLGLDRTHSFVRQALELMISDKITAVFLLNSGAHDQKTISTFENLFDVELICEKGARVPELRKRLILTAK